MSAVGAPRRHAIAGCRAAAPLSPAELAAVARVRPPARPHRRGRWLAAAGHPGAADHPPHRRREMPARRRGLAL